MSLRLNSIFHLAVVGLFATVFSGCSSTALPPGKSVLDVQAARDSAALGVSHKEATFSPHSGGFEWANQTLKASGRGNAPAGMPSAQREVAGKASAVAHAKANLNEQIKALPVGSDQTVGSIIATYITIRVAVEQEVAAARVLDSRSTSDGSYEAQVELPLQKIATILDQNQVTPDQELPAAETVVGVSQII